MSPDGAVASAKRTEAFRDQIAAAAERHDLDPDTLEALIFLESAGRPDVIAGTTPEAASGLGQILPSTATDLLGMSVDLPQSIELTRRISNSDSPGETERLQQQRAAIDQRFDPEAAIEGAATYLDIARKRFGDLQLAIASYHMGIGNLESVLRAYAHAPADTPIGDLVSSDHLSYAEVFFNSGPDSHRKAYELLSGFGDESSQYLWKILASKQILHMYRDDPERLQETATLATNKASMEEVFHPENETDVFQTPDDISNALDDGDLVPLPDEPALGWEPNKDIGELADQVDQSPDALSRPAPGGPGDAHLPGRAGPRAERRRDPAAGRQRGARPHLPGPPRAVEHPGDPGVLTAHDRLGVRHPPRLRVQEAGAQLPVPARPPAVDRPTRLRGRARRHPRHRLGHGGGAAQAVSGAGRAHTLIVITSPSATT